LISPDVLASNFPHGDISPLIFGPDRRDSLEIFPSSAFVFREGSADFSSIPSTFRRWVTPNERIEQQQSYFDYPPDVPVCPPLHIREIVERTLILDIFSPLLVNMNALLDDPHNRNRRALHVLSHWGYYGQIGDPSPEGQEVRREMMTHGHDVVIIANYVTVCSSVIERITLLCEGRGQDRIVEILFDEVNEYVYCVLTVKLQDLFLFNVHRFINCDPQEEYPSDPQEKYQTRTFRTVFRFLSETVDPRVLYAWGQAEFCTLYPIPNVPAQDVKSRDALQADFYPKTT
jgi:hypothetical protein